ncbi:MAG: formylglycine-generating enzyme family protein [Myxococcota bacterium]|jgi:formylglycine-generating enzyme required for sulfatase activity|nr:formylglycine-generating enzyme family protein [Myxococcota bacterium]
MEMTDQVRFAFWTSATAVSLFLGSLGCYQYSLKDAPDTETNTATSDSGTTDSDTTSQSDTSSTDTGTGTAPDTDTGTVDIGADWTTVPARSFWMGTPDGNCPADYTGPGGASCTSELGRSSNENLHYVRLTHAFELMQREVTQGQFAALMVYNPSYHASCGGSCPVEAVSWNDAVAYANELSLKEGRTPCYVLSNVSCLYGTSPAVHTDYMSCFDGDTLSSGGINTATVALNGVATPQACSGYRLLTESEWEYAARAGTLTAFFNGAITNADCEPLDTNLDAIGWYCGNASSKPHPVAEKAANAWGLYDMSGNVWEWTWDWYQSTYPAGSVALPLVDPVGPSSASYRVVRGGGWYDKASGSRSGNRRNYAVDRRVTYVGFRLARSVP